MKTLLLAGVAAVTLTIAAAADDTLRADVAQDYDAYLGDLWEHFHTNPELSFREFRTADRMAEELRALGIDVTQEVGQTGVVGMMRNGPGPLVLVRADMDGLPVKEDSGQYVMSTAMQEDIDGVTKPVMHACGHDVHITSLVGTARQLAARKDEWSGTVMFVVQPAEERIGGAKAMLDDGLYDRFGVPDYALAFHVSAGDPAGKVMVEEGLLASSSDSVDILVKGLGAHGASPHAGKDPIYIASQIVVALQSLVSRELSPLEPGVVTVGSFHAGFKHNIIPDQAKLELTVRSDSEETREKLLNGIKRIAEGVARTHGVPENLMPEVTWGFESTPTTVNDDDLADRVRTAIAREMGEERMYTVPREGMGAEDFAYFVMTDDDVPGTYFVVGGTSEADLAAEERGEISIPSHHSPFFKIEPEPSVTAGTEAMTIAVLELLGKDGAKSGR